MKKRLIVLTTALLFIICNMFCAGGCGEDSALKGPDYSANQKQFDFYAYSSSTDGTWNYDGEYYFSGEDFRNVERYKEYKDCGMSILLPQSSCAISEGFVWETSKAKEVMDIAQEAGIEKVILTDYRLYALVLNENLDLIGDGKAFADEAALDSHVSQLMEDYSKHDVFYGVMLNDELSYNYFKSYGQVYKSIKRVCPKAFVQCNHFPMIKSHMDTMFPPVDESLYANSDEILYAKFKAYIESFLDETGADYFMYDQYPLTNTGVYRTYLIGLQVAAQTCKERGVKLYNVTQTATRNGSTRILSDEDLRWLNNVLLGFGVKQISYFTYFTKQDNSAEHFEDGGSFITHYGEKTDIYYNMQKIIAENQKFAPTVLSFDYNASRVYCKVPTTFPSEYAICCKENELKKIKEVKVNKESVLLTELCDKENDRYMYMVMNVVDSQYKGSSTYQTTTVEFNEKYDYAAVYVNGEQTVIKLIDNKITIEQNPGEAAFVMPFNA